MTLTRTKISESLLICFVNIVVYGTLVKFVDGVRDIRKILLVKHLSVDLPQKNDGVIFWAKKYNEKCCDVYVSIPLEHLAHLWANGPSWTLKDQK